MGSANIFKMEDKTKIIRYIENGFYVIYNNSHKTILYDINNVTIEIEPYSSVKLKFNFTEIPNDYVFPDQLDKTKVICGKGRVEWNDPVIYCPHIPEISC